MSSLAPHRIQKVHPTVWRDCVAPGTQQPPLQLDTLVGSGPVGTEHGAPLLGGLLYSDGLDYILPIFGGCLLLFLLCALCFEQFCHPKPLGMSVVRAVHPGQICSLHHFLDI